MKNEILIIYFFVSLQRINQDRGITADNLIQRQSAKELSAK